MWDMIVKNMRKVVDYILVKDFISVIFLTFAGYVVFSGLLFLYVLEKYGVPNRMLNVFIVGTAGFLILYIALIRYRYERLNERLSFIFKRVIQMEVYAPILGDREVYDVVEKLRRSCIKIRKLYELMNSGVLDSDENEDVRSKLLGEIQKYFNLISEFSKKIRNGFVDVVVDDIMEYVLKSRDFLSVEEVKEIKASLGGNNVWC